MFSTAIRILLAFALACIAAGFTTVAFVMPPTDFIELSGNALTNSLSSAGLLALAAATHFAVFAFPLALIAAVFGAARGLRNPVFYVSTGIAIAVLGFFAQSAVEQSGQPTIVNEYALMAFVAAGLVGGLVYWLIAVPGPTDSGHKTSSGRRDADKQAAESA